MGKGSDRRSTFSDFLTIGSAAVFLGVSPSTLRNWDRVGKLKAARHPVNGYRLYRGSDLEKLMDHLNRLHPDEDEAMRDSKT